ncbi:MAG TPA: sigma-54-dependent Fis family transcriptional regulator [bacterium]|nr:sigma-54-dependent Fis family transcriptional regulator [bacterium]
MKRWTVLIVDDEKNTRRLIEEILKSERQYEVLQAANGMACLKKLQEESVDLVLLDLQMPGIDGIETLKEVHKIYPRLPVIIMTAHGTVEKAVSSMKLGAYDFITKPFTSERVKVTVKNALEACALEYEVKSLRSELEKKFTFENIVGQSGVMQNVFRDIDKVIDSNVTVLIQGESGTGKELFARAIHNRSQARRSHPFVAVNCTAIPESLLESELFGHEKGAFTGASSRRVGKFESANGGTVFLDEIGDMSLSTQAKILRVLQEREFERVGGNTLVKVDIRLISATNTDLDRKVREGSFREDLFYRISVFPIKLPALRQRREDIPLLAAHFIEQFARKEKKEIQSMTPDALRSLMNYHWPGNVRELENIIERAVVVSTSLEIGIQDLPTHLASLKGSTELPEESLPQWIEKMEVEILRKTLLEFEGNITRAARKLGIGRATVYRKAKKYHLPIHR